jgi:hypothetical protein
MGIISKELKEQINNVIAIDDGFRTMEKAIGFTLTEAIEDEMETALEEIAEKLQILQNMYLNMKFHANSIEIGEYIYEEERAYKLAPRYMDVTTVVYLTPDDIKKVFSYYGISDIEIDGDNLYI